MYICIVYTYEFGIFSRYGQVQTLWLDVPGCPQKVHEVCSIRSRSSTWVNWPLYSSIARALLIRFNIQLLWDPPDEMA